MRSLLHVGLVGIAAWQFAIHYHELFPSNPAQRWALHECFTENHRFDPLNPGEREACFKQNLSQLHTVAVAMPRVRPPQRNFVDLWRAAGQRRVAPNDIRALQEGNVARH